MSQFVNMMASFVITCEYCDLTLASQRNLIIHQKNSKRCLEKRNIDADKFTCDSCRKIFFNKRNIKRHEQICKEKVFLTKTNAFKKTFDEKIIEMENALQEKTKECKLLASKVEKLKERLKEAQLQIDSLKCDLSQEKGIVKGIQIAPARTIKTTNKINYKLAKLPITTVPPFTTKTIQAAIGSGKYTRKMFEAGMDGLLECFKEVVCEIRDDGICEKNYVCTDSSRKKFHRLLKTRQWQEDDGGHYLTRFFDCLKEKAEELFDTMIKEVKEARIEVNNAEDAKEECAYGKIEKTNENITEDNYYIDGIGDRSKCKNKDKLEYYKLWDRFKYAEKILEIKKGKLEKAKEIYRGIIGMNPECRNELLIEFRNKIKSLYTVNDFSPLIESADSDSEG